MTNEQAVLDMLARQQGETLDKLAMAFRLIQDLTDDRARLHLFLRRLRQSQSLPSVKRQVDAYLESIA